jgi:CRP-like cAMP-binding protein
MTSRIYYIRVGFVGIYYLSKNGRELFLSVFAPDNLVGHRFYFAKENYYTSS